MKIQQCSNVISEAPLGKLCNELLSNETAVDRKIDVLKAYVHDFVHCMYNANQEEQEEEFMVRCQKNLFILVVF